MIRNIAKTLQRWMAAVRDLVMTTKTSSAKIAAAPTTEKAAVAAGGARKRGVTAAGSGGRAAVRAGQASGVNAVLRGEVLQGAAGGATGRVADGSANAVSGVAAGLSAADAALVNVKAAAKRSKRTAKRKSAWAAPAQRDGNAKTKYRPRNHRRLARAIFKERNMVTVGKELLESKSAAVKARVWETLVNYELGEFAAPAGAAPVRQIIWDMPGPPRVPR